MNNDISDKILYEQPFNELTRACLRIEFLHSQAKFHMAAKNYWGDRATLRYIIELLQVLDRPDLKSKLTKELMRLKSSFERLSEQTNVDLNKLQDTRDQVSEQLNYLESFHGKIAVELHDDQFLSSIRSSLAKPGGSSNVDLPLYHFWLQQDSDIRHQHLQRWFAKLDPISQTIESLLRIVRSSARAKTVTAENGFYQTLLDASLPYQLVRVLVAKNQQVYPEVSVGRHRLSLRFLTADIGQRPQQAKKDISFRLTCCVL